MNADDKLLNGSYWEHGVQHSKWIDPAADAVKLLNGSNCTEYEDCKERLEIQTLKIKILITCHISVEIWLYLTVRYSHRYCHDVSSKIFGK